MKPECVNKTNNQTTYSFIPRKTKAEEWKPGQNSQKKYGKMVIPMKKIMPIDIALRQVYGKSVNCRQ